MKENLKLIAKGIFIIVLLSLLAASLAGCGHNGLMFTTGKYVNIGIDPNTGKGGIQYVTGDHIGVLEKDNAKLTVEMKDTLDGDGKKTTRISKITYEIGEQITGADVEMAEVNAKK